jgi:hypothetical protein
LWIDPNDPNRMIESNDGGANVSTNGGASWTTQANQPTAQFYHAITDNRFPYWLYGAQQDNSSVGIASAAPGGIDRPSWYPVGGGESGYIAPDPHDPEIVYAGSYGGEITRYNHHTGEEMNITPWPVNPSAPRPPTRNTAFNGRSRSSSLRTIRMCSTSPPRCSSRPATKACTGRSSVRT